MPSLKDRVRMVDVVGVGLNATDTAITLSRFPDLDSKQEILSAAIYPGGQVASAMVACRKWGLSARYVGSIGDDSAAKLHRQEFAHPKIEAHLFTRRNCSSQSSFILVDGKSGERTILWNRDRRLELHPSEVRREWIEQARILLVDGHDTRAAAQAARWARRAGMGVVADIDNCYPEVEPLLQLTTHLFSSQRFPRYLMRHSNLLMTLPEIQRRFGCQVAGATLGQFGAIAWDGRAFHYCRGFRVRAVDTTGAGDVFHAGVVFGLLRRWPLDAILEFSCAAAALDCTAPGARGAIKSLAQIRKFMRNARRSEATFPEEELRRHRRA